MVSLYDMRACFMMARKPNADFAPAFLGRLRAQPIITD
jgi:hypothetical protein